jgi:hypothetical protein
MNSGNRREFYNSRNRRGGGNNATAASGSDRPVKSRSFRQNTQTQAADDELQDSGPTPKGGTKNSVRVGGRRNEKLTSAAANEAPSVTSGGDSFSNMGEFHVEDYKTEEKLANRRAMPIVSKRNGSAAAARGGNRRIGKRPSPQVQPEGIEQQNEVDLNRKWRSAGITKVEETKAIGKSKVKILRNDQNPEN